jgi:hypothetical protein
VRVPLGAVALGVSAIALSSCGEERRFGADELVAELNERGASIELRESLPAAQDDAEIHAIEVGAREQHETGEHSESAADEEHAHGGGSLYVLADEDAALQRYRDCEQAATLTCFRAANVFLVLEDGTDPEALVQLKGAMQNLGDEG